MLTDKVKVTGNLNIDHYDSNLTKMHTYNIDNLVVTRGKEYMASRMKDTTFGAMSHMSVGSGVTAAAAGDTDLQTMISTRQALTSTTVLSNTITYVGTFAPGVCTGAITEAGIFNNATGGAGYMLARTVFGVINKSSADTIVITWTITIS